MNIDDHDDDDVETDETVPILLKVIVSLVLFSPFIISALYVILK